MMHIVSTLALSWLLMMAVHEFGHVLHAWLSGGRVKAVVLHPAAISRTDVSPNPHPLFVAWGGALWGTALPLLCVAITQPSGSRYSYLASFLAGFCCVANGSYLAAGAIAYVGDAAELLRYGASTWQLIAIGLPLAGVGLYLWNGLGGHFGLGDAGRAIDRKVTFQLFVVLVLVVVAELLLSA